MASTKLAHMSLAVVLLCCAYASAQYEDERAPRYIPSQQKVAVTPVPILKQINRHNEDGSYTYGFEAADGSFKIETKSPNGDVKGKYGYKDVDTGKLRVIEYGADKFGFQPAGEGITVAPPTLVDESKEEERNNKGSRNNFRAEQQPSIDYDYEEPAPSPPPRPRPAPPQLRAPAQSYRSTSITGSIPVKPTFFAGAAPAPVAESNLFNPAPAPARQQYRAPKQNFGSFQQQYSPQADFNQATQPQDIFSQTQAFSSQPSYQQSQPSYQQSQPSYQQSQPSYQPSQVSYQQPQAQPQFTQPQSAFEQRGQPYSMLDQLLKEFALPQGGAAPLHDITFGTQY